jgi:NADPH:quinone reductase-like Zn-dependent oxidoreductase
MKAAVYEQFGPPEMLQVCEVVKPTPKNKQVLIRIYASTVTVEDAQSRAVRGPNGFNKPRKPILGWYLAGEIEEVGKRVTKFRPGDQVYGSSGPFNLSAHAEYICLSENAPLVPKPEHISYEEAAAIPNGGLTSLPFLRDKGNIQAGQKVLINGASGAVGTSGVQLARHFGAEVTGVCSTVNLELVKSLGAHHVIDYTEEDFTQNGQTYDIIYDTVGKVSFSRSEHSLTPKGVYLNTVPMMEDIFRIIGSKFRNGKEAHLYATGLLSDRKKMKYMKCLNELVKSGELKAMIDRVYPPEQIAEAHRYVETGHKKGNVVVTVNHNGRTRQIAQPLGLQT